MFKFSKYTRLAKSLTSKQRPNIKNWDYYTGYRNKHDDNDDDDDDKDKFMDEYPVRVLNAGTGLDVTLTNYKRDETHTGMCHPLGGFIVTLTSPGQSSELIHASTIFQMSTSKDVLLAIEPILRITSEGLRNYNANRR